MKKVVHAVAPGANFIRTKDPPVMGAVILAMHAAGITPGSDIRAKLTSSISELKASHNIEVS